MEPERDWKGRATLVDLLDRIFDKGVVLYADVVISVAGIPLIGVNLRAVLAGMETMLEYGVMQDIDVKTRMWESQKRKTKELPSIKGEELILKMYGSYHYESGIYNAWKSGQIYLTNTRLLLYQKEFDEKVFETPIDRIKAITVIRQTSFTGKDRNIIHLYLQEKKVVRLSVPDTEKFKQELESLIEKAGMILDEELLREVPVEMAPDFLIIGEKIFCKGKMWNLMPKSGIMAETWKPGCLYLTNKRLFWWYEFERKISLQIPIEEIKASIKERRNLSTICKDEEVLDVIYNANGIKAVTSFSGKEIDKWEKVLNRVINKVNQEEEKTCPQCGILAQVKEL